MPKSKASSLMSVSRRLERKINMAPDLDPSVVYGTAGLASTKPIGAFLAFPLSFRKLVKTSPAVVLKNEGYNISIDTQLLEEFDGIASLLGYPVPLATDFLVGYKRTT